MVRRRDLVKSSERNLTGFATITCKYFAADNPHGFTILELVVVISVLSILASLSIPAIGNIIKQSRIDGVKAKINSAAADCLQRLRSSNESDVAADKNIISNEILEGDGYKISPNGDQCSYFSVEPIDASETFLFPMSFGITKGKLTKFAVPRGENSLQACKAWAGVNCKESEELKELIAYNQSISEAKQQCESEYSQWLNAKSSGSFNRWNPSAESACPSTPPKQVSTTCTPSGCNRKVYALDGIIVGYTQEDYDKALEEKYGRICTKKLENLRNQTPPYTNPGEQPITIRECGPQEFWFHKGKEAATQEEWTGLMCEDEVEKNINSIKATTLPYCGNKVFYFCDGKDQLSQDKLDSCIASNAEAKCIADRETARQSGYEGKYGPFQGPGTCGETRWMCNQTMMTTQEEFKESSCGTPSCKPPTAWYCPYVDPATNPECRPCS